MPIREGEKFRKRFLADTEEEGVRLLKEFDYNLELLSNKLSKLTGIDRQDLKSEGIIGLARAKRDFDETRSSNFTIFALYKIKDAMREFISTQAMDIRVPQYIVDASRLGSILKSLSEKALGPISRSFVDAWKIYVGYKEDNELSKEIKATREKIENLADRSHTSVIDLLDRADILPSTKEYTVYQNMNTFSSDYNQEAELDYKNLVDSLRDCLDKERFIQIFDLHFIEGYTIREIADKLGVADGTIAVQMGQMKNKLKHRHTYLNDIEAKSRECPPVIDISIRSANLSEADISEELDKTNESDLVNSLSTKESINSLKKLLPKEEFELLYARFVEGKTVRELEDSMGIKGPSISVKTKKIIEKILKNKDKILGHESTKSVKETEPG
jgi:RNA polymerase sigma factor (sigma-70 family)